jgi:hypothetical protein
MRVVHIPSVTIAVALLVGVATSAIAQTGGSNLTSPIAPGVNVPAGGFGAIGPGNVSIAPGEASIGDTNVERIGPGGTLVAPGMLGNGSGMRSAVPRIR